MKEFLSVKLQIYSVQIATLLLRQLIRYFLKYVRKTSCLENNILRKKKSMVDQLLNKVDTLQYAALSFTNKTELMEDLPVDALKVL